MLFRSPDPALRFQRFVSPSFDPARSVLLELDPICHVRAAPPSAGGVLGSPSVSIALHEAEHVLIETRSPRPGYLVLADGYDEGWRARVDGIEAAVLPANLNFRAVALAAGSHTVDFVYAPPAYRWGWITAGLAAAMTLALGGLAGRQARPSRALLVFVVAGFPAALGLLASRAETAAARPRDCEPAPASAPSLPPPARRPLPSPTR